MNQRLDQQPHEWIDRNKPIRFTFEGKTFEGFAGDTIASALYASDVRFLGRSFKYHRPRAAYSFAGHDSNVMMTDGTRTNIRGDVVQVEQGMQLTAVNTFGGLRQDRMRWTEQFSRFMPVGFYYKTFHRPAGLFPFHERQIRKIAGLGKINPQFPATRSPKDYAWCDVLVVGSGPSGLAAARAAGETGARVLLVEEHPHLGGSWIWQHAADREAMQLFAEHTSALAALPNVKICTNKMVGGHYADRWIALFDSQRLTKLRAGSVVYATGAIEQSAVFGNNDLPGVMLASGCQRLIHCYAIRPFRRAVVLTSNSDGYRAALDLKNAGVDVVAVVDLRHEPADASLADQLAKMNVPTIRGHGIYEALPGREKTEIVGAVVAPLDQNGELNLSKSREIACDGIAVSVGWAPNSALLSQAGIRFRYDDSLHQLVPSQWPEAVLPTGRAAGIFGLADQLAHGRCMGLAAAKQVGRFTGAIPEAPLPAQVAMSHPYPIFHHAKKKNFVEMDEDLHLTDFINAHQEGYDSIELLKRYSTVGMGPSQGKLANINAVRILAKLNGRTINETGTTTSRPFYQPVPIGHLAGRRFHPMRQTPIHDWHERHSAVCFHAGDWYRPEYYRVEGESREDSILAEAKQVRAAIGMIDVGTLGKLLVNGPDAAQFLERIYAGKFDKLEIGKYRYGIALDESGIVIEDGVIARLAADRFYVTATSSGVAAFYREMLRWAILWKLDVTLSNVTGQFAAMNVAGPKSRELLAAFTDVDLSRERFPYLGVREGSVCGVRAILMRVGFVGELGYEVHVPAGHGLEVWKTLFEAGKKYGIRPFGVEAQRLLRLEKGHIIISQDTDALTNPYEAGVDWAVRNDKPFFVGQRSLQIINRQKLTRKLVGLRWPANHVGALPEECHLIIDNNRMVGRITSIAHRSTCGYPLAMAFLEPELAQQGAQVHVRLTDGSICRAEVAPLPFYDPENQRQNME